MIIWVGKVLFVVGKVFLEDVTFEFDFHKRTMPFKTDKEFEKDVEGSPVSKEYAYLTNYKAEHSDEDFGGDPSDLEHIEVVAEVLNESSDEEKEVLVDITDRVIKKLEKKKNDSKNKNKYNCVISVLKMLKYFFYDYNPVVLLIKLAFWILKSVVKLIAKILKSICSCFRSNENQK